MAEQSTFVKLDRNILSWSWYKDTATKALFIHLILTANVKTKKWKDITIKRGQRVVSRKTLAQETGLSEQSVRTALKHLISTNEVTSHSEGIYTLITVQNYELYQGKLTKQLTNDQPGINQASTRHQPRLKNNKKDNANALSKNDKKGADAPPPADADIDPVEWEVRRNLPKRLWGVFQSEEEYEEWRAAH